ncbi:glycoside hydrolase family 16 protein [Clavulina sp. PMI_390]|nr:glycoside hydrolase family 16 protein [Clavulina sp. PMI_390]
MYTLADRWSGENFFDGWTFFEDADPTRGLVNFVSQSTAAANGLAYVEPDGKVVMKVDSSSNLPLGAHRNSVRITTTKAYNHGLFVLDATKFPYGCAVWPAFWMFGPDWPWSGEMDIYETINLAPSTQYTAHTSAGCMIDTNTSSLAGVSLTANLNYQVPSSNAYAGGTPASIGGGSYAGMLTAQGGAVLVMQWEADGIRIWNFPRTHLPKDLSLGLPTPELWPNTFLKAAWDSSTACNVDHYFRNMSLVFDITLCGDWAGQPNVYTSSGCSGSCVTQVMKGSNFINATWELNYVAVYARAY